MSGHVVVTPMVFPTAQAVAVGTGIGLAALAAVGLAIGVKRLIDMQVAQARTQMEAEKEAQAEWLEYQQDNARQLALLSNAEQVAAEMERRLVAAIPLEAAVSAAVSAESSETGFLSLGLQGFAPEEALVAVQAIRAFLDDTPPTFREAEGSPYLRLVQQCDRLVERLKSGERLREHEMSAFRTMAQATLTGFVNEVHTRRARRREFALQLEALFDDVLMYRHLARGPLEGALADLQEQLVGLMRAGEVKAGPLELVSKRLAELKAAVEEEVIRNAHRQGLCESVMNNLSDMGYARLAEFPEDPSADMLEATLRIPGGEQVRIALHRNNQIAFQVVHERPSGATPVEELTPGEHAFLDKQEARWCGDFRELLRRLVAEGFSYDVTFEQKIPSEAVKVVVLETPDEIVAQAEHETRRQRME